MRILIAFLVFLINEGLPINIDDKLDSPFSSDCFKRISIGERLIIYDVTRTVKKNQVKDCEKECNIHKCTYFSFGIGAAGNGTCELSTHRDVSRRQDADYDLYQRTSECAQGKPTGYEEACYRKLVTGRRLDERFIRHSLPCDTLEACQHQCSVEKHFKCQGFNIRLDKQNAGRGICELSAIPSPYLEPSRDFLFDPEFDYYEKDPTSNSPNCGYINEVINVVPKGNSEDRKSGRPTTGGPYYGGDSYGPWSTGYGSSDHGPWGPYGYGGGSYVSNNPTRGPVPPFRPENRYPNDYYGSGAGKPYNNFHPNEIPRFRHFDEKQPRSYYPDRNNYWKQTPSPGYIIIDADDNRRNSRQQYNDIAPYRPPPDYPQQRPPTYGPPYNLAPGPSDNFHGFNFNDLGHEVCFQRAHPGHRLNPSCVRGSFNMPTVLDCESMCMKASFKCTGYSFRYSNSREPNCALTDFTFLNPKMHLLPDRSCDVYFKMATCLDYNGLGDTECFSKAISNQKIAPNMVQRAVTVPGISDCELECLRAEIFTCRSFTFRYGPGVIGEPMENCLMSDWPISALQPRDFVPSMGHQVYERGSYGHGCELDSGPPWIGPGPTDVGYPMRPNDRYPWNREDTWKRFTVRGWPCRAGTQCQLNPDAGFWSCEVEGGDYAQWDYCCRPRHPCGYSRGFNYPWCYVGEAGPDQWRPCSEQYYPDFGNRPPPGSGPFDGYGPPRSNRPWNQGQDEYGPPSYWPISYLYNEPPPNETTSWMPESHHHSHDHRDHHRHHHSEDHDDDTPKIKFKPTTNKVPFPKAIVQKLDVKDVPTAGDPGDEMNSEEKLQGVNPRNNYSKKLETADKVPLSDLKYVISSNSNCDKDDLKNEVESFASSTSKPQYISGFIPVLSSNSTALIYSTNKRQLSDKIQESVPGNKTNDDKVKQVISKVEKIIQESSKEVTNQTETSKSNETLKKDSSENIGYVTRFYEVEKSNPKADDSAMTRFWNWSKNKYDR